MSAIEKYTNKIYPKTYKFGDVGPSGGYIFITPYTVGNTTGKYFETAPFEYAGGINTYKTWAQSSPVNYQSTLVSGADGIAIGTGYQNTLDIVAQGNNNAGTSAAAYVRSLTINEKNDWFLPSYAELSELMKIINTPCWSSTEINASEVYTLSFFPISEIAWEISSSFKSQDFYIGFPVRSFLPQDSGVFVDRVQRIGNDSVYGGGQDGTVVIASNTSLTKDMYYTNLTINNGVHLNTNGFKVFVKNALTINGSIGINAGVAVSNATLAGTSNIASSTTNSIGGNAAGVTYTASQVSSDVRSYIENILTGTFVSTSGIVNAFRGGAGGGNGSAGIVTPAATGTGATSGAVGTAGTGATAGGAGGAGDLTPHRNVLAPGGSGSPGTPGTNGAAGTAGSSGTNGAAGSTPPAAAAGAGARGGGIVLVCAKSITGTGTIISKGSNAGVGGPSATGTGAGAGANGTGAGAGGVGSDGVAGTAAPGQAVSHHVNSHAHIISGDGTHGAHVQIPSPALPRGHVAAAHGQHAHGTYTNTHHGATPVHPANHHGGSSPTYGGASTTHAHVAPSGYYHQNSIPHNAGGHLGHDGAVAHGDSMSIEFGSNHYHEVDHHHVIDFKGNQHTTNAHRPRTDHIGHHYNGDHRQAGDQRHAGHVHKAGGAAGAKGLKGTNGTPGTNGIAGTPGTNGSTTAGTNGQSGGGGGVFIITDSTPTGVTTSVSGGTIGGVGASGGNVITVLNA